MPRIPKQGSPIENLPAVDVCRQRGWNIGQRIHSSKWVGPRTIIGIENKFVRLKGRGTDRVRSFPTDVEAVSWEV